MEHGESATLSDVARLAGVSLATASRALNGSSRQVRPEYVQRVVAAAEELHYSTNVQAQAVARGSTMTLALIVGDVADPYFSSIGAGAMREADAAGLVLTMTATNGDPERERSALELVTGLRPRAVVLAQSRRVAGPGGRDAVLDRSLDALAARGAGVVTLSSDLPQDDVPGGDGPPAVARLVLGNHDGARSLAEALVGVGHRRFAVLAGDPGLVTAVARTRGFLLGLDEHGIAVAPDRIVPGAFNRDGGHAAMTALLDTGMSSGCVFAVTDVMAVGALAAIRERGLVPGRDIAVAGFDDVRTLADVVPSLTTVRLPLEEIGASAVRIALGQEHGHLVPGEVVLRQSTAR